MLSLLPDMGDRASSLVTCFAGGHPKARCAYSVGAGAGSLPGPVPTSFAADWHFHVWGQLHLIPISVNL